MVKACRTAPCSTAGDMSPPGAPSSRACSRAWPSEYWGSSCLQARCRMACKVPFLGTCTRTPSSISNFIQTAAISYNLFTMVKYYNS
eukprot:1159895-Pelagomonas_calceolata.AAC.6